MWPGLAKQAEALGSGLPDQATTSAQQDSVPSIALGNKPAAGQRGPAGLSPRQTNSRVNTGVPPVPSIGAMAKSMQPKVAQETKMTTTARPSLDELMKAAMQGTAQAVDVFAEARHQGVSIPAEKVAEAAPLESVNGEYIDKLASALDYLAEEAVKQANSQGPGLGPNPSHVLTSGSPKQEIHVGNSGHSEKASPGSPSSGLPGAVKDPKTALKVNSTGSNEHKTLPQGSPGHAGPVNAKTAEANLEYLRKLAAGPSVLSGLGGAAATGQLPMPELTPEQQAAAGGGQAGALAQRIGQGASAGGLMGALGGAGAGYMGTNIALHDAAGIRDPKLLAALSAGGALVGGVGGAIGGHKLQQALKSRYPINPDPAAEMAAVGGSPEEVAAAAQQAEQPKVALASANLEFLRKLAGGEAPAGVSATGSDKPKLDGQAAAQEHLITDPKHIKDVTREQTKAVPKKEVGRVLEHAALSASTDQTLAHALVHTESSGAKVASESPSSFMKEAAARALVLKLAPQSASGGNAASQS